MVDDFIKNVDLLLKHGFVEANNRMDYYSDGVDQIKITNYGMYMLSELGFVFSYLDLVCTDTGIFNESVSNFLVEAARKEYQYFIKHQRLDRVKIRLSRVEKFIEYLKTEEQRERDFYSLGMPEEDMFTYKSSTAFEEERIRVIASAKKQSHSTGGRRR